MAKDNLTAILYGINDIRLVSIANFLIILYPCSQLFHPDDERFSFFFSCDKSILTRLCSIKYDIRLRVKYLRTYACIQLVMKVFDRII